MHTVTLNTKEAPTKWWARKDAEDRNLMNSSLWSDWDKIRADFIKLDLMLIYRARGYYVSYGKLGISVKVDKIYSIADRKHLRQAEKKWAQEGVYRKETPQGVIYRFM